MLYVETIGDVQLGSDGVNVFYAVSTIDRDGSGAQVQIHGHEAGSFFSESAVKSTRRTLALPLTTRPRPCTMRGT